MAMPAFTVDRCAVDDERETVYGRTRHGRIFRQHTSKIPVSAIVYYITGHGYGHAVRSSLVIRELKRLRPELSIYIRTTAPVWLFDGAEERGEYFHAALDVGVVQSDSLEMNLEATAGACRRLHDGIDDVIARERAFIGERRVKLVVGDIPPLAFEIAARSSLPSVAITNFTWDFIYRAYAGRHPDFNSLTGQMERFYARASLALTLPYPCEMKAFRIREAIAWIMRSSPLSRKEARSRFNLPQEATIVLLSFGGFGLARLPWQTLAQQQPFHFVTTGEGAHARRNVSVLPAPQRRYHDLLRAADAVVTKPGYGIVADAIAHRVPVLYTDRGEFPEYPNLVQALRECATSAYISQSDLLAGKLSPHLDKLLRMSPNWPSVPSGGAEQAARKILEFLDA
jgi:L-arabinokinase